jgi:hypothetical protein
MAKAYWGAILALSRRALEYLDAVRAAATAIAMTSTQVRSE